MKVHFVRTLDEYRHYCDQMGSEALRLDAELAALIPNRAKPFTLRGYSYPAGQVVDFRVDYQYGGGHPQVNWRERVECPLTGLSNRLRYTVMLFDLYGNCFADDPIYIMEQLGPLYGFLKRRHPNLVGSEYLGAAVPLGAKNAQGIRNEDATTLTFADQELSAVLSFDVFEHMEDYPKALAECYRVLKPGGCLLFSVPFLYDSQETQRRARSSPGGPVEHLLPPHYHGDPLSDQGILCYWDFGWSLLDELRQIGFKDAMALLGRGLEMGHPDQQILFLARK